MANANPTQSVDLNRFRHFLELLPQPSASQIEDLLGNALSIRSTRAAFAEIEAKPEREQACPHCGSDRCQRWGQTRTSVQRYRCSDCERTYSGLTGSLICGLHRHDLFFEAIRNMFSGHRLSCRKLGRRLGRSKDTIWRWRMLILDGLGVASDGACAGIVVTDVALCTDGAAAYSRFSNKTGMTHHVVSNKPGRGVIQRAVHIQNVTSLHERYCEFIKLFRRPASKYLERYLHWFLLRSKLEPEAAFGRVMDS